MITLGTEVEREPISLSALEFDVLWEHLNLGAMPLVVKVPSPGKTDEERAELEEQAWSDLESRGLGRKVDLDPDIEPMLRLLARPEREVDGRTYVDRGVRLLAASAGDEAALVVLGQGQLTLRKASAANLAGAAFGVLPARPAGSGRSVTLRSEDFEAAANDASRTRDGFRAALRARGVRADDADALTDMIDDVKATGNFGAAARDRLDRRMRADRVVSFFDTDDGRYVQIRRKSADGNLWTTISPADSRKLVHHLDELLTEIVRAAE